MNLDNSKRIEALIRISVYPRYLDIRGHPQISAISAISVYPRISVDYPWIVYIDSFIREHLSAMKNIYPLSVIRTDTRITDTRIQTLSYTVWDKKNEKSGHVTKNDLHRRK